MLSQYTQKKINSRNTVQLRIRFKTRELIVTDLTQKQDESVDHDLHANLLGMKTVNRWRRHFQMIVCHTLFMFIFINGELAFSHLIGGYSSIGEYWIKAISITFYQYPIWQAVTETEWTSSNSPLFKCVQIFMARRNILMLYLKKWKSIIIGMSCKTYWLKCWSTIERLQDWAPLYSAKPSKIRSSSSHPLERL